MFDGVMEMLADALNSKPEWVRDNPAAAIRDFLAKHTDFEVDAHYSRAGVTYCPGGFFTTQAHLSRSNHEPSEHLDANVLREFVDLFRRWKHQDFW